MARHPALSGEKMAMAIFCRRVPSPLAGKGQGGGGEGGNAVDLVRPGKVAYSSGCESRPGRVSHPPGSESLD